MTKNIFKLLICLLVLQCACHVEKRRYQKGFYVDRSNSRPGKKEASKVAGKTLHQPKTDKEIKSQTADIRVASGDIEVSASADHFIRPMKVLRKLLANISEPDSCDVLIFKDGSEVRAKVLEVGLTDIKYKRCDNLEGPSYVTRKSQLFMIKYMNGSRELMPAEKEVQKTEDRPTRNYQPKPRRVTHPLAPYSFGSSMLTVILAYVSFLFLVLGSFSGFLPVWYYAIIMLAALTAVVVGNIAMKKINAEPDVYKGKGLAIPGIVVGIVFLVIFGLIGLVVFLPL